MLLCGVVIILRVVLCSVVYVSVCSRVLFVCVGVLIRVACVVLCFVYCVCYYCCSYMCLCVCMLRVSPCLFLGVCVFGFAVIMYVPFF